jgi:hypothetical protein
MSVSPMADLTPGPYTVDWTSLDSTDGHEAQGLYTFVVNGGSVGIINGIAQGEAPAAELMAALTVTAAQDGSSLLRVDLNDTTGVERVRIRNGVKTPGISDVRVDTYCKRQAIRDKFRGQIDEKTFNYRLSLGVGLETALADDGGAKGWRSLGQAGAHLPRVWHLASSEADPSPAGRRTPAVRPTGRVLARVAVSRTSADRCCPGSRPPDFRQDRFRPWPWAGANVAGRTRRWSPQACAAAHQLVRRPRRLLAGSSSGSRRCGWAARLELVDGAGPILFEQA